MKNSLLITCPTCGYTINGRLWRCPGCGAYESMQTAGKPQQKSRSGIIATLLARIIKKA